MVATTHPVEVADGLFRVDWAIGTKPMASYLLVGDDVALVDSGIITTPAEVYRPAIEALGRRLADVGMLVITHADADHIGGNHAARGLFPNLMLACHHDDLHWASDPATLTAERYDGFTPYGLRYDQATFDRLASWMGPAESIDTILRAGERLPLGNANLTVHHVPGHSPGHICLHDASRGFALIGDAVFGRSQLDTHGGWSAAPPYDDVAAYRSSIGTLRRLAPELMLGCHYPPMRGDEVTAFLDASEAWVDDAAAFVADLLAGERGPVSLTRAIEAANPVLGPYANPGELRWAMRAHLEAMVADRTARHVERDGIITWEATG